MINLYALHPTSSFTVYPDTQPNEVSGSSFVLELTSDLDQSTYTVDNLTRINTKTSNPFSSLIVLQATSGSSNIPSYDGQYTANLKYGPITRTKWGSAHYLFGSFHKKWSNVSEFSGSLVSTDRTYVHGTNLQTIDTYVGTDQTGAYTTYNY
jgi:hypothetical protein